MNDSIKPHVQQFDDGFGDIDPTAAGRAAEASAAVHAQYQGWIDAISEDRGLSPEQRAVAIYGLRQRQHLEASGASEAVMAAAVGAASSRREMMRLAGQRPAPQQNPPELADAVRLQENSGSRQSGRGSSGVTAPSFRAAARALTHPANLSPKPRRRRGETDKGSPMPRYDFRTGAVAQGRYGALQIKRLPEAVDLGMETPSIQSGSFNLSLCNSYGGFESEGSDHGLEGFDAPESSANLDSLGL